LSFAVLPACGSAGAPLVAPVANHANFPASNALFEPAGARDRLYAADAGGFGPSSPVYVYKERGTNRKPLGSFGTFSSPLALATDLAGNIYVPDWGHSAYDGRVYVYANPLSPPFLTLDDTGALPSDLTVAADGTVYVANGFDQALCGGQAGDVRVYPKGQAQSAYAICDAGISQPYSQINGVALDPKGDVFVTWEAASNTYGMVREFTPGPHFKGHFLKPVFKLPYAVGVDGAGDVVVSDVRVPAIEVFAPGASSPKFTLAKTGDPTRFAFGASGRRIFVADALANQIDEYDYPQGTLVDTIAFPGAQLDGVAVSPPWTGRSAP
jgi:hypothetical protein